MLMTTLGIAIVILVGYLTTLVIVRPDEIDFEFFKHISFNVKKSIKKKKTKGSNL